MTQKHALRPSLVFQPKKLHSRSLSDLCPFVLFFVFFLNVSKNNIHILVHSIYSFKQQEESFDSKESICVSSSPSEDTYRLTSLPISFHISINHFSKICSACSIQDRSANLSQKGPSEVFRSIND